MKSTTVPTQTAVTTTIQEDGERLYMPNLGSFKACSFTVGFLVGLFIYLSTLGAEFVAVMLWGKDILTKTNQELIFFSLGWNLGTTFLALIVLTCLRRLVLSVFTAAITTTHRSHSNKEDLASELLSYLEGRFAVGALVGICFCWNITNMILGMRPQIIQSCIILAVACLWCRVTLILLGSPSSEALIYDHIDDDTQEEDNNKVVMYTGGNNQEDAKLEPLLNV